VYNWAGNHDIIPILFKTTKIAFSKFWDETNGITGAVAVPYSDTFFVSTRNYVALFRIQRGEKSIEQHV
jgi:hypothetical protein